MMKQRLTQWGEGLVLIATGASVLLLWVQNSLAFYVYPGYIPLIVGAAFGVVLLGVLYLIFGGKPGAHCAHDHAHHGMFVVLCMIPIFLMLFVTPRSLSSTTAVNRGLESYLGESTDIEVPGFYLDSSQRSLLDWIRLLQQRPEPEYYLDKEVRVEGLVIRSEDMLSRQFMIGQFVVACCAADARPVGLYVETEGELPEVDSWIELEGVFVEGEVDGQRRAVIQLNSYTVTDQPSTPYEYL